MAHHNHGPQMLTANRLRDGDVLYWKGGGWVLDLAEGEVYRRPGRRRRRAGRGQAELRTGNEFVAPYLFEVREEDGKIRPVKEREIIRAAGPTRAPRYRQAGGSPCLSARQTRRAQHVSV